MSNQNDMTLATNVERRQPLPPSPCVGVCTMRGEYCYGCGRTGDEIAAWASMAPDAQSKVWAQLPTRLAGFGFKTFRLASGAQVVAEFLGRSLRETDGQWRLVSASLECVLNVPTKDGVRPEVVETDREVRATLPTGEYLSLIKHDKVRVFGFIAAPHAESMDTVALVLPKGRAQRDLEVASGPLASDERVIELPDTFARASLVGGETDALADVETALQNGQRSGGRVFEKTTARLHLINGLGEAETGNVRFAPEVPKAGANAPSDLKISTAFAACAIFHCNDPDWLARALAP